MAASAETPVPVTRERDNCLLVQPSPSTSLHFTSASDYLHHLISHGECHIGVNIEPCGPPGCHLEVGKPPPPLDSLLPASKSSSVKNVLKSSSLTELGSPDEQGLTPLLYAALTGAHAIAAVLLKAGVSPDTTHTDTGASPLSLACTHDHPDTVKVLLKHRASTTADREGHGCTPLHCAAWAGGLKCVKLLLSLSPTLISVRDQAGRTPLHYASARGDVGMCQLLLKRGAKLSDTDKAGRTSLHWAILSLEQHCVEYLLTASSSAVALCNQSDSHGATPVHYAAMTGKSDLVSAMVEKGGDVSVCDSSNYSPLVWACAHGCLDTSRQLLKLTSRDLPSSDTPDDCVTETGLCLRIACGVGSVDVCQLLIRTSSSVAKAADEEGRTALHTASLHGHTECVDKVLEAGAPPDTATNTQHKTSLHISSELGYHETVLSLLEAGASHDLPTHPEGERPIHLAARSGHADILRELIGHGCAPDIRRASDGQTALHLAAEAGHIECCRTLLEKGADPTITDTSIQCLTALDMALCGGHREVSDYLISQGAPSGGGMFHRAALTIQAVWRLHRHRRRCYSRRQWSAVMIQRAVQRWQRRRRARRVRAAREKTRHIAATIIQQSWRQYMEGRRRYEATCARLRARLHQEKLAASLLMEELQSQTHSIQLPPPSTTSYRGPLHTAPHSSTTPHTHRAPTTPGYLLHAAAPLPRPLTSASLLSPTRQCRPLPSTSRPRKPHPSRRSQHPRRHQRREEESTDSALPPLPTGPSPPAQLPSKMSRGSSQSNTHTAPTVSKKLTKSSSEADKRFPMIASSGLGLVCGVGSGEQSEKKQKQVVSDELYPLPPLRSPSSQTSPTPPPPPPPPQPSPRSPPSQASPPPQGPSPPPTLPPSLPPNAESTKDTVATDQSNYQNDSQSDSQQGGVSEGETTVDRERDSGRYGSTGNSRHSYMKKTAFRTALLGQKMGRQQREEDRKTEEQRGWEGEVDSRLLGPIQRYDRLNRVLSLLQQVQQSESEEGGGEGLKLSSLHDHIQTALDEAVRLRAETDSLHTKLTQKSTNSVKTT